MLLWIGESKHNYHILRTDVSGEAVFKSNDRSGFYVLDSFLPTKTANGDSSRVGDV